MGFKVNRFIKMVLRLQKGGIIGAFNCLAGKKTEFLYKAHTQVSGFMIRKHIWLEIVESIPEITNHLKENIKIKYIRDIYLKVINEKKKFLRNFAEKKGNDKIISVH